MKNLLTLFLLLISITSIGQSKISRGARNNTNEDYRVDVLFNLYIPRYADTTTANANIGIDSCGAKIFTYSDGKNKEWTRYCSPKRWVLNSTYENLNLTTIGTAGPATFNRSTYTLNIPNYTVTGNGTSGTGSPTIVTWLGNQYSIGGGGAVTLPSPTTTQVIEAANLYFTLARARGSISLTTNGTTGASTYDPLTGRFNIPNYTYLLPTASSTVLGGVRVNGQTGIIIDPATGQLGIPLMIPRSVPFIGANGLPTENNSALNFDGTNLNAGLSDPANPTGVTLNNKRAAILASDSGMIVRLGNSSVSDQPDIKKKFFINNLGHTYLKIETSGIPLDYLSYRNTGYATMDWLPSKDNYYDLGNATLRWRYINGRHLNVDSITINGITYTTIQKPIGLTTIGSIGAATFNPTTGILNIPNYSLSSGGNTTNGITDTTDMHNKLYNSIYDIKPQGDSALQYHKWNGQWITVVHKGFGSTATGGVTLSQVDSAIAANKLRFGIEDNTGVQDRTINLTNNYLDIVSGTSDFSGQTSEIFIAGQVVQLYNKSSDLDKTSIKLQDGQVTITAADHMENQTNLIVKSNTATLDLNNSGVARQIALSVNNIYADSTGNIDLGTIGGGSGVTSVATNNGTGIIGGTITTTGTLALDTANIVSTKRNAQKIKDSLEAQILSNTAGIAANTTAIGDNLGRLINDSAYLKGLIDSKPIPVNADWNSVSGLSQILNKPNLATVATTGSYNDLTNKPTIPAAQVNSDWNASSGLAQILNKPSLATVATTGNYNDLSNKPTIPTGVTSITLNTPSIVYTNPITFTNTAGAWAGTLTPINQSPYTVFGNNTASSTTPSFFINPYSDSLRRIGTTVSRRVNGNWVPQYTDSVGGGGGGTAGWSLPGNSAVGYDQFFGTTDTSSIRVRLNNVERAAFSSRWPFRVDSIYVWQGAGALSGNFSISRSEGSAAGGVPLGKVTTGTHNTSVGTSNLSNLTSGASNVGIGFQSGINITTGSGNVGIGEFALSGLTTGSGNIGIGTQAGSSFASASNNTAIGMQAFNSNTSGGSNVAIGQDAYRFGTSGFNNVVVGATASQYTTPSYATILGMGAMVSSGSSQGTVAVGYSAGYAATGNFNILMGYRTGSGMTTGAYNTVIGVNELGNIGLTTGSYNTIIGGNISGLSASLSNTVILADGQGNKRITVNSSGATNFGNMTNTTRDAMTGMTEGAWIYSLTDHTYEFWNGTVWKAITTN